MTKKIPHLRQVEGHWLCTYDRTERHFLRGYWGDTPMQAFYNFMFHSRILKAEEEFRSAKKICPNELVGKPA